MVINYSIYVYSLLKARIISEYMHICRLGGVYLEVGQPSLPRSRVSVKFFVKICFRLCERRTSPPWRDLAIDYRDLA